MTEKSGISVVVEQLVRAAPGEAWDAITRHEQMTQWFFTNIPDFETVTGFQTVFPVQSGERTFTHVWKILEVVSNRLIRYHWSYVEYPGTGSVTFELTGKEDRTLIRVTNKGLETFPQDIPEFSAESCQEGWKYFLGRLKEFIEMNG